jgi:hypothetical protein
MPRLGMPDARPTVKREISGRRKLGHVMVLPAFAAAVSYILCWLHVAGKGESRITWSSGKSAVAYTAQFILHPIPCLLQVDTHPHEGGFEYYGIAELGSRRHSGRGHANMNVANN